SAARFAKNTAFSSGRTFGNLSLGGNQNYNTNGGNDTTVLNDFTIESGSSFSLSFSPGGNLIVDGNFEDKNSSAGTFDANGHIVKFSGGNSLQTIKKAGVLNPLTF